MIQTFINKKAHSHLPRDCLWIPIKLLNVTRFAKGFLYMHSFKTHFSSPFDSYINKPTAHVFNTAEGWIVCFHGGLFLKPVCHSLVLGWPSNGLIFPWQAYSQLWFTTRLADEFGHGFSYFVWYVEVKMASVDAIWLFLVKTLPLPTTLWLPAHPSHSHPIGVLVVLATPVKTI